eukprot:151865-Prorocentrum_minimum.AAC.1
MACCAGGLGGRGGRTRRGGEDGRAERGGAGAAGTSIPFVLGSPGACSDALTRSPFSGPTGIPRYRNSHWAGVADGLVNQPSTGRISPFSTS